MPRKKPLPAVRDEDTERPALTEKQQAFVNAVASGETRKNAAVQAGYAEATASVEAWRLLQNPLILKEIEYQSRMRFAATAPEMINVIRELALTAKSGMVRLMAAQDWLDRAGYKPIERQQTMIAGELKVSIDLT